MIRTKSLLAAAATALLLATSLLTSSTKGSMAPAAVDLPRMTQVRAQYMDISGNRDETFTTVLLVNTSVSHDIVLDDLLALGSDGLDEVLATHTASRGRVLPPLGSIDLAVNGSTFPGLTPVLEFGELGLMSVVVTWTGPKDALQLKSSLLLNQPGTLDNRAISIFDGHHVTK